ncbi:hypothetical protein GPECTOR_53g112 [Gonium pectorale]|uniref:Uncharacterized protein n=1 Tax=Gonium pectorale TaxID=33097 RepID=A0A150G6M9_GONPE|nr:hypothetical protein GPECTOR_53g112 [Gonium pectorale]|eukprot:KXZ45526.1 hypothetical protein GPECTOR_53g112 [Gonium pectorale]
MLTVLASDTGLILLLYQTIALPLPYRVHMAVQAAVLGMLAALHNGETCTTLRASCHAGWFRSPLPSPHNQHEHNHHHHRRLMRLALAVMRPLAAAFSSTASPPSSSPRGGLSPADPAAQTCWCSLVGVQVVAGFLLPGMVTYLMEEAARRRYLAGRMGGMRQ